MPIYVYQIVHADGSEGSTFEWLQGMNEPVLTHHPETGEMVRRCISAPAVAGKYSELKSTSKLSDKNLGNKGFTKYVKSADGRYEKAAGKGPKVITRKQS